MNRMGFLGRTCIVGLILAPVLLCSCPLDAQKSPGTSVIVVLFDGITLDDIYDVNRPNLSRLARHGAVGLMNTAVAGPKNDTSAMLTLALGALAPSEPTDEEAYQNDEKVEGDRAEFVYRRRAGIDNEQGHQMPDIFHLGIAPLVRRGLAGRTVGAIAAKAGKPISCVGHA